MQQFPKNFDAEDRLIVRRWRLVSAGIYGSIVAALILFISLQQNRAVDHASVSTAALDEFISAPPR